MEVIRLTIKDFIKHVSPEIEVRIYSAENFGGWKLGELIEIMIAGKIQDSKDCFYNLHIVDYTIYKSHINLVIK